MDRRRFLQLTAASLAATPFLKGCETPAQPPPPVVPPSLDPQDYDAGTPVQFSPDAIALDEALFAVGVQAGSSRALAEGASAVLWTAVDSPVTDLRLRIWREGKGDGEVVLVKDLAVSADAEGFVKAPIDGLAPSTVYSYGFFVGDATVGSQSFTARSTLGSFRTAYAIDWLWPVTLGATTCTNPRNAPYTALDRLAEEPIDAFVHLGDMVYADGSITREDYRAHYRAALQDPGYRAVLGKAGGMFVWDDHEFDNNPNPEELDPRKLENGAAEFYATLPMLPNETGKLWQSWRWGVTVEVFALDCRTERLPSTRDTDTPVYIGAEQMAWLKQSLVDSPCHFKVLLNSVPMTRMSEMWPLQGDRWQGYEAQRNELLKFLEDNGIENVWFLSGDFHIGFVSRVEATGFGRNVFEAAVGPGGNLGNPLGFLATQPGYYDQIFPPEQFFYGAGELAATTLVFDPLTDSVRVKYIATDGSILFDDVIKKS